MRADREYRLQTGVLPPHVGCPTPARTRGGEATRAVASGVQRVPIMHPQGSVGPPRTPYPPMRSRHTEFSCYTFDASCSQLSSFGVTGAPNKDPILSRGPLERARAPRSRVNGAPWRLTGPLELPHNGAPDLTHQSGKVLAMSMDATF